MKRLSPYSIGAPPVFDPCEKCIIKVNCSEICDDRFRWVMNNKKPTKLTISLSRKKKRRKKKC